MMPADAVRIDYVAPAACPSSDDFQTQVADRAPHAHFADEGARARTLVVRVTARRGGFHGTLVVRELDGTQAARSVDASTCPQLVTGLALIAALAVDSKPSEGSTNATGVTSTNANGSENTTASTNANSNPSASANPPSDAASQNSPEKQAEKQPEKPPDSRSHETKLSETNPPDDGEEKDHASQSPSTRHAIEFSFGIDGGLVGGTSPNVLPTLPVFAEIGRGRGHGIFTPSVRARFERPGGDANASSQGSAHFTWTEGSVDLCPIAYAPISRLRLVPCVRGETGVVDATGSGVAPAREETRPWLVLGLVARARVDIVGPLFGEIEGAVGAPLVRDRFYLEPDFTVFRASAFAWSSAAGLGVTIW